MKTAILACVLVAVALLAFGHWLAAGVLFAAPLVAIGGLVVGAMVVGDRPEVVE